MHLKNSRLASCACVIALICTLAPKLKADPPTTDPLPQPPYAIITYPSADPTTQSVSVVSPGVDGVFALVGLVPNEIVQVTVQYPTSEALGLVSLNALDGGMILPPSSLDIATQSVSAPWGLVQQLLPVILQPKIPQVPSLIIGADGTLSFTFVATSNPGKNQVSLQEGGQELGLQFWVLDPQNVQNNPPTINPGNPNPAAAD